MTHEAEDSDLHRLTRSAPIATVAHLPLAHFAKQVGNSN
jgi:hypothetical protein